MLPSPIKTPEEMLFESAGIPHMQAGGQPPRSTAMAGQQNTPSTFVGGLQSTPSTFLGGLGPLLDMTSPNPISFYRANPQNKFGAKDGLETIKSRVDKTTMEDFVKAMRAGEKYGVPQLPPEYLAALLLQERRGDFGFNELNKHNKKAQQIAELLMQEGFDDASAGFGGALYDKMQIAMRLKKPFSTVWNGTGISKYGKTGDQYTDEFGQGFNAVMHPKNQNLLEAIKEAYNYQPPQPPQGISAEGLANAMPQFNVGGSTTPFYDMSKMVIQKHLSGK